MLQRLTHTHTVYNTNTYNINNHRYNNDTYYNELQCVTTISTHNISKTHTLINNESVLNIQHNIVLHAITIIIVIHIILVVLNISYIQHMIL